MRILVTGHEGYLGAVMARVLSSAGHDVVGLDTGYFAGCAPLGRLAEIPTVRKDVRDVSAAELAGCGAVVHLAALCNDPLGDMNEEWTYDINYRASVRLARLARDAGVSRFLYASSCSVYGKGGDDVADERAPLRPVTAYAVTKIRAEEEIAALADGTFSPVLMRNATVYGLSPRLRGDVVLNNLCLWAHTTGRLRILSDGSPWRPIVHVEDVARAFLAVLEAPRERVHAEAFNVGSDDENYRVRDIAEIVRQAVPGCGVEYAGTANPDQRSYRVDFSKLRRHVPGFACAHDARSAARELCAALAEGAVSREDFGGTRFVRLAELQALLRDGRLGRDLRWVAAAPPPSDRRGEGRA